MKRKAVPRQIQISCRSQYGPLKIGFQPVGPPGMYLTYLEDGRFIGDPKHEGTFTSTPKEALAKAVQLAASYLKSKGEHTDYEPDWKCCDTSSLKPVQVP